ncbi:hypothetical protein V8C37DRAFT_400138 [Trichoderma ceciliae]
MAAFSRPMIVPGSLGNVTQFVNTTALPLETLVRPLHEGKQKEDKTDLIFAYAIIGAIFAAFFGIVLADLCRKHMPKRDPNHRSLVMKGVDKVHEKLVASSHNSFARLFTKKKSRGSDIESAAAKDLDSQAIIDRLAAKPAGTEAALSAASDEGKSVGPMASIEVTVTPLKLPFLDRAKVENANADHDRAVVGL